MILYVVRNPNWKDTYGFELIQRGWGNGYVAVSPTHPAYKISYDDLWKTISIHGVLTYSEFGDNENAPRNWWVFGFDTAHFGDNIEKWSKEAVEAETKKLFCQLLDMELGGEL